MIKNNDTKDNIDAESASKKKLQPVLKDDGAKETGGPKGLEPTRYGDWERKGRCVDFWGPSLKFKHLVIACAIKVNLVENVSIKVAEFSRSAAFSFKVKMIVC